MGIKLNKQMNFKEGEYLCTYKNRDDDKEFTKHFVFKKRWFLTDLPQTENTEIIEVLHLR